MSTRKPSTPRTSRRLLGKPDTRQQLIDTALQLLDQNKSFDGLSLRELTREVGIVPTAFYRHFSGMEELGLALVDDAFRALRKILDDLRGDARSGETNLGNVVKSLVRHVQKHRIHFRFVASERFGGDRGVRDGIRRELRLVQSELATDLARLPLLREWSTPDLQMIAILMVNNMVAVVEEIMERTDSDKSAEKDLLLLAEKQLRLIMLGVPSWRSSL